MELLKPSKCHKTIGFPGMLNFVVEIEQYGNRNFNDWYIH
ncbi:MAG: hypothetical protein RL463_465 [Bacteroidota bacterium]|jgi:hypothetical protein